MKCLYRNCTQVMISLILLTLSSNRDEDVRTIAQYREKLRLMCTEDEEMNSPSVRLLRVSGTLHVQDGGGGTGPPAAKPLPARINALLEAHCRECRRGCNIVERMPDGVITEGNDGDKDDTPSSSSSSSTTTSLPPLDASSPLKLVFKQADKDEEVGRVFTVWSPKKGAILTSCPVGEAIDGIARLEYSMRPQREEPEPACLERGQSSSSKKSKKKTKRKKKPSRQLTKPLAPPAPPAGYLLSESSIEHVGAWPSLR